MIVLSEKAHSSRQIRSTWRAEQSDLIGAPERMSIEAVLAAPNEGGFWSPGWYWPGNTA
jgi:hypothetical protein